MSVLPGRFIFNQMPPSKYYSHVNSSEGVPDIVGYAIVVFVVVIAIILWRKIKKK